MTDAIKATSSTPVTEPKFTAAQIDENCPVELQDLGKRIAVQYEKALKYEDKADQNYTTVAQLLAAAHGACDEGGFNAFRERFFPKLGKSRVYELLAIGNDKKSIEEVRAGNRARVAKHRANKAATSASVTVTENLEPDPQVAPEEYSEIEAPSIALEQKPEPKKPRSSVSSGDTSVREFNSLLSRLLQICRNTKAKRYDGTSIDPDELAWLGGLITEVANRKKAETVRPAPTMAPTDNRTISAERSAEDFREDADGEASLAALVPSDVDD